MKIGKLIKDLQELKRLGAKEVWFANDEEGNNIVKEAIIEGYNPELYQEGDTVIVLCPLSEQEG